VHIYVLFFFNKARVARPVVIDLFVMELSFYIYTL